VVLRITAQPTSIDVIGFVLTDDGDHLTVRDQHGVEHRVSRDDLLTWRLVGVALGRDPRRTPRAELDRLAAASGLAGRCFVARISALLGDQLRPPGAADEPAPVPATLNGEWVTTADASALSALAWWATQRGARSIQVRTDDPAIAAELAALGFSESDR
jgi:hypothetical protein